MKLNVERDDLYAALTHATRVVERAKEVLIFSTVVLSASGGEISVTASNLQMSVRTKTRADVQVYGEAAVPLEPLFKLLQRLPAGTAMRLDHNEDGRELAIHYRRSRAALPTLPPEAYTVLEAPKDVATTQILSGALVRLLSAPSHIPNEHSQRLFERGIHLHYCEPEDSIVGVSTDGLRITCAKADADDATRLLVPVTVPIKAAEEIVRLAQSAPGAMLALTATQHIFSVASAHAQLTTRLVDEAYPDYRRCIPADRDRSLAVPSGDLTSAIQRALTVIDDKERTLRFSVADGSLSIRSRNTTGGTIEEIIEVDGGDGVSFAVNATKMAEALSAVAAEVVELASDGPAAPIVVRKKGGGDVLSVIMPLRG